jgi:hypothetical protein
MTAWPDSFEATTAAVAAATASTAAAEGSAVEWVWNCILASVR